ncbi:MAG: cell division protein FtsQ [Gammaproteobacteria bacterium]|nr:MAG: cell division protein FtsQ [Gammaproteobacteria bacterium]RLA61311.1 MAG: cell division protein FtsQ [Gammaproteobacteria bacterium]
MAQAMKKSRVRAPVRKGRPGKKVRSAEHCPQQDRPAKSSRRRPTQGATRNTPGPVERPRTLSTWFNRALILVGVAMVLAAGAQAYITLQSIPVQRISVTGELEYTQTEAVQEMVQPALAGGFLNADLQQIRRQLEMLPWIFEATVRRKWPNALEIHVVEQLPIARWGSDGFLNHEGQVFHSAKIGEWQSLPLLLGPDGTAGELVANYQRLAELLAPIGLAVEQLAVDERGQVEAVLAGGMQLIVGSDDFLERMHRFVAIYRTELAARAEDVQRVDLRYESGIAVAFSDSSQMVGL